jgi:hypothetical protein
MISPAVIKILLSGASVLALFLYVKNLQNTVKELETNYSNEVQAHQEVSNVLLAERLETVQVNKLAVELEERFNEISEQNDKYRKCINDRTCYVSLRKQAAETSTKESSGSTSTSANLQKQIDGEIQRDILDLRKSIEEDAAMINGYIKFITDHCKN